MNTHDDLSRVTEELRAEFYRRRLRLYEIAPSVGQHPSRVGAALNGKLPMTPALAERLRAAIEGTDTPFTTTSKKAAHVVPDRDSRPPSTRPGVTTR